MFSDCRKVWESELDLLGGHLTILTQNKQKLINGCINFFPNKGSINTEAKQIDGITFTSMFLQN